MPGGRDDQRFDRRPFRRQVRDRFMVEVGQAHRHEDVPHPQGERFVEQEIEVAELDDGVLIVLRVVRACAAVFELDLSVHDDPVVKSEPDVRDETHDVPLGLAPGLVGRVAVVVLEVGVFLELVLAVAADGDGRFRMVDLRRGDAERTDAVVGIDRRVDRVFERGDLVDERVAALRVTAFHLGDLRLERVDLLLKRFVVGGRRQRGSATERKKNFFHRVFPFMGCFLGNKRFEQQRRDAAVRIRPSQAEDQRTDFFDAQGPEQPVPDGERPAVVAAHPLGGVVQLVHVGRNEPPLRPVAETQRHVRMAEIGPQNIEGEDKGIDARDLDDPQARAEKIDENARHRAGAQRVTPPEQEVLHGMDPVESERVERFGAVVHGVKAP